MIETLELEVKLWNDDKERAGVFAQIGKIYDEQLGDGERAMHYYESALTVEYPMELVVRNSSGPAPASAKRAPTARKR